MCWSAGCVAKDVRRYVELHYQEIRWFIGPPQNVVRNWSVGDARRCPVALGRGATMSELRLAICRMAGEELVFKMRWVTL
jgi:hypothetical protein